VNTFQSEGPLRTGLQQVYTGQHDRDRHERVQHSQRHEEIVAHLMQTPVEPNGCAGHDAPGQNRRRNGQQPGRQGRPADADADRRRLRGRRRPETVPFGYGGRHGLGR